MSYDKTRGLFILLAVLVVFYATNIFFTRNIYSTIVGTPIKISFIILDAPKDRCEKCFDANIIINRIKISHKVEYEVSHVSDKSILSQKYVDRYNIKNLPAIVISGDIENKKIVSAWKALLGRKTEDRIIIENLLPYYDLKEGKVRGVIDIVILKDKTCKKCFSEDIFTDILKKIGVVIDDKNVYDISSVKGRALVRKYAINKVPTLILPPNVGDYPEFTTSWKKEIGTVEENGMYVLREVQKLSPEYKEI